MDKIRVFFSYSLRGSDLTRSDLERLKEKMKELPMVETYVDILDNRSPDPQGQVMEELTRADVVCVLLSERIGSSVWVKKELDAAAQKSLPVLHWTLQDVRSVVEAASAGELLQNSVIERMLRLGGRPREDAPQ